MAGARIEIDISAEAAADALVSIERLLSPEGLPPLLADIGEYLVRSTRDRAETQTSPDGVPWAALSPRYARRKEKERPGVGMLHFDNHMLGDRFTYQVASPALYVGTSAPYGAVQQFGETLHVAARSQQAYFHMTKGDVDPLFVKKGRSNFAQWVTLPEHDVTIPARPWLGLSDDDVDEIVQLVKDHLALPLEGPQEAAL